MAVITAPMLFLLGCADVAGGAYTLPQGDANYDALKAATDACRAKGGVVSLRKGYDDRQLSSYVCAKSEAR